MHSAQPLANAATARGLGEGQSRRLGRVEELQAQIERLKAKIHIAVVYGGDNRVEGAVINPTFNPRAWKSYRSVAEDIATALTRLGFRHIQVVPEDMKLGDRLRRNGTDLAWLNTGGVQGYNSMAHGPAMLEMLGIPYVGHDPLTIGMLDNKHAFKRGLKALGIPTAPFMVMHITDSEWPSRDCKNFRSAFGDYDGPFIVKPVSGRASRLVCLVSNTAQLKEAVSEVLHATQNHVLIEQFLPGREFCIAACGPVAAHGGVLTRYDEPFVFSGIERVLGPNEKIFTSMDFKPITERRVRALDALSDYKELSRLNELARDVFCDFGLETLVRLDVRMDSGDEMYVLEANPKPDLKYPSGEQTNLICAGLDSHDMTYDDLILSLLADRIDLLLSQRRGTATNLLALLDEL